MEIGFFFWPFNVELIKKLAEVGERHAYDMVCVADTPGNAMDPWVSATILAEHTQKVRIGLCVTNLISRMPSVSAGAIASLNMVAGDRAVLGIGAGHSGTRNVGGVKTTTAKDLAEGTRYIRTLLRGEPAEMDGGVAQMPWIKRPSKVFLAASHPKSLAAAGATADGAFINYGLGAENVKESVALVRQGAVEAGRKPEEVEIWQVGLLDCHEDGEVARQKVGAMLAFVAGYAIGTRDLDKRGVPEKHREPLLELRRRYSTRPGDANIELVRELGLFDYLSARFAICGNPDDCLRQMLAARDAGVERVIFSISMAADPVKTAELFATKVFPILRQTAR